MATERERPALKPLEWVGSSKMDLIGLPESVRKEFGHQLHLVQAGERPIGAKPLRGFGGASVLELSSDFDGNTIRAIYTVRFPRSVFVLHVLQKKSKKGIATPKADLEVLKQRLKSAAERYRQIHERNDS